MIWKMTGKLHPSFYLNLINATAPAITSRLNSSIMTDNQAGETVFAVAIKMSFVGFCVFVELGCVPGWGCTSFRGSVVVLFVRFERQISG